MKKFFLVILSLTILASSCGRRGALEHLPDEKRPNFDNVIDEDY